MPVTRTARAAAAANAAVEDAKQSAAAAVEALQRAKVAAAEAAALAKAEAAALPERLEAALEAENAALERDARLKDPPVTIECSCGKTSLGFFQVSKNSRSEANNC